MNQSNIIQKFNLIKYGEGNIDAVYRSNLLLFKYELSDVKHVARDKFIYEDGLLKSNVALACYTSDGFHIDERHFLAEEIKILDKIIVEDLSFGDKQKYIAYREYILFKAKYPEWFYIKDRNGFYSLKNSKLPKYKKAINSGYFKDIYQRLNEDKSKNTFYYRTISYDWKEQRDELLKENQNLSPRLKILLFYNAILRSLLERTISLFVVVDKYDGQVRGQINDFNFTLYDVKQTLKTVGNFSQNINHNINTGHYKIALEMQHYCLLMFDDIIGMMDSRFFVNIWRSPLGKEYQSVYDKLKHAIDIEKLDLLLRVGGQPKVANTNDSQFEFSDSDRTFKTIEGRKVFERYHSFYATQDNKSKHYSFLHYALKKFNYTSLSKEKFIVLCGNIGVEFSYATRNTWLNIKDDEPMKLDFLRFQFEVQKSGQIKPDTNQNNSDTN